MNLQNPDYYLNRELSWLEFNDRVLEEALDKTNPLMERLKFLAISASNLDEFFMVRVSSLAGIDSVATDPSGLTPREQIDAIAQRAHEMVARQYSCFTRSLLPAMEREGIRLLGYEDLSMSQRNFTDAYFNEVIYQVLTPMAIDKSRPFPVLNNRTVNLFIELSPNDGVAALPVRAVEWDEAAGRWRIRDGVDEGPLYALVQVPTILPRILPLPADETEGFHYILLEQVILAHIGRLFLGHTVTRTSFLRVTRNFDITLDEEDTDDLLLEMTRSIRGRRWGEPVRIEISKGMSPAARRVLSRALNFSESKLYEISGPLDLSPWQAFANAPEFSHLCNRPLPPCPAPAFSQAESMFDVIRRGDALVHHPYMSFDCVVRFIQEAATDPRVLAIKQTLYRVSGESEIISALIQAAENGKQVTVMVELKARLDEENNINWAKLLDKAGIHVVYGLAGLKTHCKISLVVRQEDDIIRRYVHMSTGNYNEATAKIYTDTGYFTCREAFGHDAGELFNVLTGYLKATSWKKLAVAPLTLRQTLLQLIEDETQQANNGKPAQITAKMNSLSDVEMIQALYRASAAGVRVQLLVRGICCLRAGLPEISENISVSSIIDRFLEHSRIFIFGTGDRRRVFLSSADLMPRNLDRRVEALFPIEDIALQNELADMLDLSLSDNVKRRELQPDGTYKKPDRRGRTAVQAQLEIYRRILEQEVM